MEKTTHDYYIETSDPDRLIHYRETIYPDCEIYHEVEIVDHARADEREAFANTLRPAVMRRIRACAREHGLRLRNTHRMYLRCITRQHR